MVVTKTPCRLFVIHARRAHVAVILLRGPAKWTQVIRWDTASDTFTDGQWFHGTFYDRRCDLSPSGERMVYFVAQHHRQNVDPTYTNAWTAISKPPYLTAVALWPNGGTTYHGGGLFEDESTLLLNSIESRWANVQEGRMPSAHPKHAPPARLKVVPISHAAGDQLFPRRLVRDGWTQVTAADLRGETMIERGELVRARDGFQIDLSFDHQRANYVLHEAASRNSRHELRRLDTLEGAQWADWDLRGRLLVAKEGRLFAVQTKPRGELPELVELADFNGRRPARVLSPAAARKW